LHYIIFDYTINDTAGVFTCATSSLSVPISDYEYIDDVYEKIMKYEKQGTFIYEKYETLPQYRYDIIRGIIMRSIKRDNLLYNTTHLNNKFYQEKFPQNRKEAEVLCKHALL